ncbi:sensor histidine kinase [Methylocystis heyeri]|uniref:Oxygen sensor histidine kinase NreB n=1 Tax=Methylocystis heyeri TaxID=391905 RepID=A0A6B8KF14_9HYPH|nr:ATP-binding protein [Methylocystis heyeri]QGM47054.1 PAS domain S-box protein [Methylocystis heyeri]
MTYEGSALPEGTLALALEGAHFGVGTADADLVVSRRHGPLSLWLPAEGESLCSSPFLLHMEGALLALRRGEGDDIVLPSMRGPELSAVRVTISISWSAERRSFVIVTTLDHGGDQIERLLASGRREKQLLQQQAEAVAARLHIANTLYRDIVECAGDLVVRFHADGRVAFANRFAARFLGLAQDALLGRPIDVLFPSADPRNVWRLDGYAERPASFEMAARNALGEAVWLWWDVRYSGPEGGGEFQAVGRDVTHVRRLAAEQEKAREEARAAALASQRLRIAQDLHDTLVRSIVSLILEMGLIAKTTADPSARGALADLQAQARAGLDEAREAITQLRARREDGDPAAIVEGFSARMQNIRPLESSFRSEIDFFSLPVETAETLNRILREALRNVELHANAGGVEVELSQQAGGLRLVVADDGAGFDSSRLPGGHFGLAGMKERAQSLGGRLEIISAPGEGTRVVFEAPIGEAGPGGVPFQAD